MSRIDKENLQNRCWRTDHNQARLINWAREKAHAKHGLNSIEALPASDPDWLAILAEEFGEVAHALTYDSRDNQALANELLDVMAVAGAWLDALRVEGVRPVSGAWLA